MSKQIKYLLAGAVIIGGLALAVFAYRAAFFGKDSFRTPPPHVEKMKGSHEAAIVIHEFSDFQCPSCKFAQQPLKKILDTFSDVVAVHFHHFPLEMHPYAMDASLSAECAGKEGKFWPYHDLLFEQQETWVRDPDPKALFLAYANSLGFDRAKFMACVMDPAMRKEVEKDRQLGMGQNVSSTPTFFIGDERLVGAKQLDERGALAIKQKLEALASKK